MTVTSTTSRKDYIQGSPPTDTFPYNFKIFAATDLKVYVNGVLKTIYTVTGVGLDAGNVIFAGVNIPAVGANIAIIRELPLTQLVDYKEGDKFPAETHEGLADRMVMIAQRMYEQLLKTVKIPIYSPITEIEIPIQANSFLKWNSDATKVVCVPEWVAGTPLPTHGEDHEDEGGDEINLEGLSGMPADLETHGPRHEKDGDDEISIEGLSGKPADVYDKIVQIVNYQTGAVATGTTQIPFDDSIPQITEGTQFLSRTITPKGSDNMLNFDIALFGSINAARDAFVVALFKNGVSDALAAGAVIGDAADDMTMVHFKHSMVAGSTSEITFTVRAGPAGANTFTLNGSATARKLGGVMASSITITEIAV